MPGFRLVLSMLHKGIIMMRKTSLKGFMKVSFEVKDLKEQRWGFCYQSNSIHGEKMKLMKLNSI